jgi:ATP-dependent Clp protease ATP-binding subunit ClpC
MTSIRIGRTLKSGIASVVSASLFLSSAGWPVARAYAQSVHIAPVGEAGSAARALPTAGLTSVSAIPSLTVAMPSAFSALPAASAPSASAPAASALRAAPVSAAASAAPALRAFPAAASTPEKAPDAAPAPAAPAPAPSKASDSGPRWVESDPSAPGNGKVSEESGPRWVAPVKTGLSGWVTNQLSRWTKADAAVSRQQFDGDSAHAAETPSETNTGAAHAHSHALSGAASATDRIVEDHSIPTPEAARLVGELRHEHGTPLWAKVVAPISVVAAIVAAVHFGAVGVLTLGAGLVLSVLAHEVAHLAVLKSLGDHTAEHAGSHSLNPFHHIDAVKTIIVPAISLALSSAFLPFPILIGSGKAVDADFNNLRSPLGGPRSARNAFWVAAAGPLTNFALAGLAFAAAAFLPAGGLLAGVAIGLAHMNVALGVFNLLPLPQLDGGKMLASALPERFYAKWVYNPRVEKNYQGLFRRLYEGPTSLLTFVADVLGVKSQKTLNRVANGVTFVALGAFYAVAYLHFAVAVPLLFLALPCTYDYWCIREKVRSEAAVKDVMDIFSQWSAVISQIAEDRGMASEVSLFETEHAMKNALETLVDEMMAKEEFRALSEEEKIAQLMAAYPDKAADFLKDKVFTEDADTKEKILELLKDSRNTPFYERIRRWFGEHSIFDRWDNPKYEGKLRDQMKDAEKPKSRGQGGSTTLGMMGFLALVGGASMLFPEIGHHAAGIAGLGMLGLMGTLGLGGSTPTSKFQVRPGDEGHDVRVRFVEGTTLAQARNALVAYPGIRQEDAGNLFVFTVPASDAASAEAIARAVAALDSVEKVSVPNDVHMRLTSSEEESTQESLPFPESTAVPQADGDSTDHADPIAARHSVPAPAWQAKLRTARGGPHTRFTVLFKHGTPVEIARRILSAFEHKSPLGGPTRIVFRVDAPNAVAAADATRELTKLEQVELVTVAASVYHRVTGRSEPSAEEEPSPAAEEPAAVTPSVPVVEPAAASEPETAEQAAARHAAEVASAAAEPETGSWEKKIDGAESMSDRELRVTYAADLSDEVKAKLTKTIHDHDHILNIAAADGGRYEATFRGTVAENAEAARAFAKLKAVTGLVVSRAVRDALLATPLPAKVASHGKEQWSTSAVLVNFTADTPEADIHRILSNEGEKRVLRHGDAYVAVYADAAKGATGAKVLAARDEVKSVEVHPNAAALLENKVLKPYPDAASYDPAQVILIQFKPGTTAEQVKAYAELRRLQLVYPKFRGAEGLALMTVLMGGDVTATRQMLIDETLDEGSIVADVKPFKEQPGDAALAPSAAAVARAKARQDALAAAEEAKTHKPRRDVQAEWINFLQTRKMVDGTTLNDKQVQALAEYLKPVAKGPGETRPPVVARTEEVKRMLPIVTSPRGMRNSVILVGGAGTGKTAVAEGLAEMIEDAEHASSNDSEQFLQFQRLKGRWLVELDINKILTADEPVKVLNAVLDLLPRFNDPNPSRGNEVIVLMDEIQKFFLDNNGQKIANVLKGPLRDGKISVIATTTDTEYKKFIESDDAFRRRLERIVVEEPTVDQTIRILRAMKGWLQKIHDAVIPDATLVSAAKLADQFDKTNFNPDKSIKAVQDAAELSRPENLRAAITLEIRETWNDLTVAANEARQLLLDKGIASTLALPVEMYNKVAELIKKAEKLYGEREAVADGKGQVAVDVVKRVIAQKTGIGSGQLNMAEEDAARYVKMEETVGARVVNQEPAIRAIADAIRRNKAGLSNPNRPMGKFLMVGPTGVGKTYLAKELARFLFNDPDAMIRMDMSEYMEEHTAQRLTGSPPGYVGYDEGGQLTEAVRKKPYSVILFDEVEKAHPKVFDVLLQILDDGRLTDGQGRTVDFKNTVILMTSNAGMAAVDGAEFVRRIKAAKKALADSGATPQQILEAASKIEAEWDADIDAQVAEALHGRFRPEFLNRLDDGPTRLDADGHPVGDPSTKVKWIRVNRLRQQDMKKIAELQVKEFKNLLADRHETDLVVDPSVIEFLSEEGFSPLYGARPMTGAIEKHIIDPLANWILTEASQGRKSVRGGLIRVTMKDGLVVFTAEAKPESTLTRTVMRDASAAMAAEVFSLIERLVGEGDGEEPSEGLFDKLLRASRPESSSTGEAKVDAAPAARAFFAPGAPLAMPADAKVVVATHNRAKAVDAPIRAELKAVTEAVAAGWPEPVSSALTNPAGLPGEGWLKQFVAFAKDRAEKAGVAAPIELVSAVDGDRVRVLVHSDAALTDADKAYLAAHFTGSPPASYEAAQQVVDQLNLNGGIIRNHNLLDLYRRLRDIPGARMGWSEGAAARGGKGTDLWLEVRKELPKPAEAPALTQTPAAADGKATPYQEREMAKTRDLMMRFVDQSHLKEADQDGTAIRVAAAESFARLTGPADLATARAWIADNKWAEPGRPQMSLTSKNALVMAATLILKRFGGAEDILLLENMSGNVTDYSHYQVPMHNAFVDALAALYRQAGLTATREAAHRIAQRKADNSSFNDRDAVNALSRAIGAIGYPADLDTAKRDAVGMADLYRRMGKDAELRAKFYDEDAWKKADAAEKTAILTFVGAQAEPTDDTFTYLGMILRGTRAGDRVVRYQVAQAWADQVARTGRTNGLGAAMDAYFSKHGIKSYEDIWGVLYAYVLAAEQAGGADTIASLEKIMLVEPGSISSNHEQMYFSTPEAWAKAVIRNGKFAEYARPTLGADGAPQPSRLQQMLTDKLHPMMVAGALRAIALARDPSFRPKAEAPKGDVPVIAHDVPQSHSGGYHGGYMYGSRHDYLMRRFEHMDPRY